jgi:hypothetical protein
MVFTLETAISELRRAAPEFPIDSEWEQDKNSCLAYNDFARFICSEAEVQQYLAPGEEATQFSKVPICMRFLESAPEQGDAEVRDMIFGLCLHSLRLPGGSSNQRSGLGLKSVRSGPGRHSLFADIKSVKGDSEWVTRYTYITRFSCGEVAIFPKHLIYERSVRFLR